MDPESAATIKTYFSVCDFLNNTSRISSKDISSWRGEEHERGEYIKLEGRYLGRLMSRAKIFTLSPRILEYLWGSLDDWVLKESGLNYDFLSEVKRRPLVLDNRFCGEGSKEASIKRNKNEMFYESFLDFICDSYSACGYPDHLPFDVMYMGYGTGVELSYFQTALRFQDVNHISLATVGGDLRKEVSVEDFSSYKLLGHLITSTGIVYELNSYELLLPVTFRSGKSISCFPDEFFPPGEWKYTDLDLKHAFNMASRALAEEGDPPLPGTCKDYDLAYYAPHNGPVDTVLTAAPKGSYVFSRKMTGFAFSSNRHSRVGNEALISEGEWERWPTFGKNKASVKEYMDTNQNDGFWITPLSLTGWLINSLINIINENNKTFIFEGTYDKETRRELMRKHKKLLKKKKKKLPLPAYNVIDIKPRITRKVVNSAVRKATSGVRHLSSRHDRDGHERVHVQRGSLPLSEDNRQLLQHRNYVIYTEGQPDDANKDRLIRRRLPLRAPGEWIAIRTAWVNSCVVGDESLPYKPSVRRLPQDSVFDLIQTNPIFDNL